MKKSFLYNLFRKNLLLKILSVVFSLVLWSYVMAVVNPPRDKIVRDVAIGFTNESHLTEENLVVRGDRQQILKNIDVRTTVNARDYPSLTREYLKASLDLSNIYTPGVYTLQVNVTPLLSNVKVVSKNPSTINVEIDTLATRVVPVQPQFEGELPASYWHSQPELSPQSLQIRGPMKDLEKVQQAVCYIPLDGVTKSYNDSMRVVLMDSAGVVIENASDLPSVIVKMDVLPKKTVDIDIDSALVGKDHIKDGYDIKDIRVTPSEVEIAAPQAVLDSIEKLSVDSINLQNLDESLLTTVSIKRPAGLVMCSEDSIEVLVDIVEKTRTDTFEGLPIAIENLPKGYSVMLSADTGSLTLTGPLSVLNALKKSSIGLFVDAAGLEAGSSTVPVKMRLPKETQSQLQGIALPQSVTITLIKK